jgi:hypothetical protein
LLFRNWRPLLPHIATEGWTEEVFMCFCSIYQSVSQTNIFFGFTFLYASELNWV